MTHPVHTTNAELTLTLALAVMVNITTAIDLPPSASKYMEDKPLGAMALLFIDAISGNGVYQTMSSSQ